MKNFLIADRYARSLIGAIPEDSRLEEIRDMLEELGELVKTNQDLRNVISNPAVSIDKRIAILDGILAHENGPDVLRNLVRVLAQRGRISLLADVARRFATHTDTRLNRVSAQVTSAVALSDDQCNDIVASLEKFSGMHVRIENAVDPSILGGIIARIGGTIIDGSVRARIERLKQSLLPEENLGG